MTLTLEVTRKEMALLYAALACKEQFYRTKAAQATGLAEQAAYAASMHAVRRLWAKLPPIPSDTESDTH